MRWAGTRDKGLEEREEATERKGPVWRGWVPENMAWFEEGRPE